MAEQEHRPLRILHTENSQAWGGQEVRILTEARGMLDRGHQVKLLAVPDSPIGAEAKEMGIPVEFLEISRKRPRSLLILRRWLAQHGHEYDVINTHSSTDSWLTAIACHTLSGMPPIVRTRHVSTTINNHPTTRWLYMKATSHIVTTGEALRLQLNRNNGYPLDHMTSIRTGIDLVRFTPLHKQGMRAALGVRDLPTLGILATLRSWKGHDDLLEAFALLHPLFPEWQLLLIGDGPQRKNLEKLVDGLKIRDAVRFVGNVSDVPGWLATLDLFVLPSYGDEGVPQSIMQAMACGLAVVSTPVGAIREAVQHDLTGIIALPRNPSVLAEALRWLMQDEALRNRMGEAGAAYAKANFCIESMLDKMEGIFYRCAAI